MPRHRVRLNSGRVRLDEPPSRRHRVRLKRRIRLTKRIVKVWRPSWENEIRGWTLKYLHDNFWRLEHNLYCFEDMLQEAYCVFLKIADHYPRVVEPAHFMSLYKTSLRNMLTDKSREYGRKVELINENVDATEPYTESILSAFPSVEKEIEVISTLLNGPPEIRRLVEFISDDANLELLRAPQREQRGEPRMTIDQRLSQLLGTGPFPFKKCFKELLFG